MQMFIYISHNGLWLLGRMFKKSTLFLIDWDIRNFILFRSKANFLKSLVSTSDACINTRRTRRRSDFFFICLFCFNQRYWWTKATESAAYVVSVCTCFASGNKTFENHGYFLQRIFFNRTENWCPKKLSNETIFFLENCTFPYRIGLFHEDSAWRNTSYGKNAFQNRRVLKIVESEKHEDN